MNKEELIKLLQNEETAQTVLNLVNSTALKDIKVENAKKVPTAKEIAAQRKLDREAEKKSSLSENLIQRLRSRVEKAAAKEEEAKYQKREILDDKYTEGGILPSDLSAEGGLQPDREISEFEALSEYFSEGEEEKQKEEVKPTNTLASKLEKLKNFVSKQQKKTPPKKPKKDATIIAPKQESDYRLVLKRVCPVCEKETRVIKYKSRLPVVSHDVDLCTRYNGVNPYMYAVMSCEHCGYAAEERKFLAKLPKRHQELLMEFLSDGEMAIPFTEERTLEEAVQLTEMAVHFCDLTDCSPSRKANLLIKIAWIYRYAENKEQEKIYLEKAVEMYEESLKTERAYAGNISGNTVMYLICAIYYLIGEYKKSASNLSRLVSDKNIKAQEPRIYERARDLWQDIRILQKSGDVKNG